MALGAQRGSVYRLVLQEATWLIAIGLLLGIGGSVAAAKAMGDLLFGYGWYDLTTLVAVASALGLSALLATFVPARRAASVNPVEALRAE